MDYCLSNQKLVLPISQRVNSIEEHLQKLYKKIEQNIVKLDNAEHIIQKQKLKSDEKWFDVNENFEENEDELSAMCEEDWYEDYEEEDFEDYEEEDFEDYEEDNEDFEEKDVELNSSSEDEWYAVNEDFEEKIVEQNSSVPVSLVNHQFLNLNTEKCKEKFKDFEENVLDMELAAEFKNKELQVSEEEITSLKSLLLRYQCTVKHPFSNLDSGYFTDNENCILELYNFQKGICDMELALDKSNKLTIYKNITGSLKNMFPKIFFWVNHPSINSNTDLCTEIKKFKKDLCDFGGKISSESNCEFKNNASEVSEEKMETLKTILLQIKHCTKVFLLLVLKENNRTNT